MRPAWPAYWPDEDGNDTPVLRHGRPGIRVAHRRLAVTFAAAVLAGGGVAGVVAQGGAPLPVGGFDTPDPGAPRGPGRLPPRLGARAPVVIGHRSPVMVVPAPVHVLVTVGKTTPAGGGVVDAVVADDPLVGASPSPSPAAGVVVANSPSSGPSTRPGHPSHSPHSPAPSDG